MSATVSDDLAAQVENAPSLPPTRTLIGTLLKVASGVSDIFLSPMRAPEVRACGQIVRVPAGSLPVLVPEDTRRIVTDLIGTRPRVLPRLEAEGSCDFSCFLTGLGRFRVNIFSQRGSYAIALRAISDPQIPDLESLHLPAQMEKVMRMRSGLVVVSGSTGSGKSSTVAAILNRINEEKEVHIVTIEDPIEYQLRHKKATVLQREIHRDVPNYPTAIRAGLRHPPHVMMLSRIPDRETMDLAIEAADCGHLVFAEMHTPDVSRTVGHILRFFSPAEERATRERLARSLRGIVAQRLFPRKGGQGQAPVFEILFSTPRTRNCIANGEAGVMSLRDAIREGSAAGMQCFEDELRRLQSADAIETETGWEELFGDRDAGRNGDVHGAPGKNEVPPVKA